MTKIIRVTAEVEIPKTPNFLRMTDGQVLPLSAIDEASLRSVAKKWTEELIEKSRQPAVQADKTA